MVKVRVISRSAENYMRDSNGTMEMIHHNPSPTLHPFERAKEYTRALNAVKLDRMFAKPFLYALDAHSDGVYRMIKHPRKLTTLISGTCDGEIRVWDLSTRTTRLSLAGAHSGFVRGLAVVHTAHSHENESFLSCGDDKAIKLWSLPDDNDDNNAKHLRKPRQIFLGSNILTSIDHQRNSTVFATAGSVVDIWDHSRAEPIQSFDWGCDTITNVRFNPIETYTLASTANDRSICLYDLRTEAPVRKLITKMRSNAIVWNPMEAFNFSVANEDNNCYTFDMRKLDRALNVHMDHVQAVIDLDYSPTGREIVSGSYDRTVRIFGVDQGRSREIYHTKRMQRIFSVLYTMDNSYVLSGSDDTNIRVWKAHASKPIGVLNPRHRKSLEYRSKLEDRYGHLPEIKRIARHRQVPKSIKLARNEKHIRNEARLRRERNVFQNSRAGTVKFTPQRQKVIVAQEE